MCGEQRPGRSNQLLQPGRDCCPQQGIVLQQPCTGAAPQGRCWRWSQGPEWLFGQSWTLAGWLFGNTEEVHTLHKFRSGPMTDAEAWRRNKAHSRTHHHAVHAPESGGVWISSVLPIIFRVLTSILITVGLWLWQNSWCAISCSCLMG